MAKKRVEQGHLALDPAKEEAAACRPGQRAFGNGRREGSREARVDGVSALLEHARASLGGGFAPGGDRSLHKLRVKKLYGCR